MNFGSKIKQGKNKVTIMDINNQVEKWTNELHDARYTDNYHARVCEQCDSIYFPYYEKMCTSNYNSNKEFCCEKCRNEYDEENYVFLDSVKN